jgi:hypothetical protein
MRFDSILSKELAELYLKLPSIIESLEERLFRFQLANPRSEALKEKRDHLQLLQSIQNVLSGIHEYRIPEALDFIWSVVQHLSTDKRSSLGLIWVRKGPLWLNQKPQMIFRPGIIH